MFEAKLGTWQGSEKEWNCREGTPGDIRGFKIAPPACGTMELARGHRVVMETICYQGVKLNGKVRFPLDLVLCLRGRRLFGSFSN